MKKRYTKILTALMLLAAFCAGVAFPASAQDKSEKNINGSYKSGISLPENLWVTHSLLTCLDLTVHLSSHNRSWSLRIS